MAVPPDLNSTIGSLEIGLIVSMFFFGIVTIQTFVYYNSGMSNDSALLKISIGIIWLLELAHTICFSHSVYTMTITDYGHPERLVQVPSTLYISLTFSGFVGPTVQTLYAIRIRKLARDTLIPIMCWILALLHVAGNLMLTVKSLQSTSLAQLEAECSWLLTTILVADMTADMLIAGSLCFLFSKERRYAVKRTAKLLDILILWTMQTGLLTSVSTVAQLILFLSMKQTLIWMAFFTTIAKFYSNSLLAALNGRATLRKLDMQTVVTVAHGFEMQVRDHSPPGSAIDFAADSSTSQQSQIGYYPQNTDKQQIGSDS